MKRIIATALATASLAAFGSASAHARTVEASIALRTVRITQIPSVQVPVYGNPAASNGVYFRQARCAYVIGQEAGDPSLANGIFGYVVAIAEDEADFNDPHTFTATSSAGNLSVQFYEGLGTCDSTLAAPGTIPEALFDTEGGEEGTIPPFATHAIVVVEDADDVDISFTIEDAAQS